VQACSAAAYSAGVEVEGAFAPAAWLEAQASYTFMATQNCLGLAAPQINHRVRAIVVDVTRARTDTVVMINPVITKASKDLQRVDDGCMSVKFGWERGVTYRPKRITVEFYDEECNLRKRKLAGQLAAVVHHEIDHLDGKLFTDLLDSPRGAVSVVKPKGTEETGSDRPAAPDRVEAP
jgi:peptide deformylase